MHSAGFSLPNGAYYVGRARYGAMGGSFEVQLMAGAVAEGVLISAAEAASMGINTPEEALVAVQRRMETHMSKNVQAVDDYLDGPLSQALTGRRRPQSIYIPEEQAPQPKSQAVATVDEKEVARGAVKEYLGELFDQVAPEGVVDAHLDSLFDSLAPGDALAEAAVDAHLDSLFDRLAPGDALAEAAVDDHLNSLFDRLAPSNASAEAAVDEHLTGLFDSLATTPTEALVDRHIAQLFDSLAPEAPEDAHLEGLFADALTEAAVDDELDRLISEAGAGATST
eukprot:g1420.t1